MQKNTYRSFTYNKIYELFTKNNETMENDVLTEISENIERGIYNYIIDISDKRTVIK